MQIILEINMEFATLIAAVAMTLLLVWFTVKPGLLSKGELILGSVLGVLLLVRCLALVFGW